MEIGVVDGKYMTRDKVIAMIYDDIMPALKATPEYGDEKAKSGRKKELDRMEEFKAFRRILRSMVPRGKRGIPVLWAERWKQDEIRSRPCAQDVKRKQGADYFAATPSPAGPRLLLAVADLMGYDVQTCDLSNAFVHAELDEKGYCEPTDEDRERAGELKDKDYVWELLKALYGLRKTPEIYSEWFARQMKALGFRQVQADSQIFIHDEKKPYLYMHVDDGVAIGNKDGLACLFEEMKKVMMLKVEGIVQKGQHFDFVGHRYTRLTDGGWTTSIIPGYVEETLTLLGMDNCKGARTPGMPSMTKKDLEMDEKKLDEAGHHLYRKVVGRVQYLCGDRDDLLYAVKECSCDLASPSEYSMKKIKKVLRYLQHTKNMVQVLRLTAKPKTLHTFVDPNFTNDAKTRKSTSSGTSWMGGVGGVRLSSWCRSQETVSLSTGEAEFDAIVAGVCEAQFLKSVAEDILGWKLRNRIHTDSSAARGMCMRSGVGRVKHLDVKLQVRDVGQPGGREYEEPPAGAARVPADAHAVREQRR